MSLSSSLSSSSSSLFTSPLCSFCTKPVTYGEVLSDERVLCPACKPCLFFERNLTLTGDYAGRAFKLMPWMEKVLRDVFGTLDDEGMRVYRDVYLEVPSGSSKALALDTPIPTPRSGWVTMRDLVIGDRVLGPGEIPCTVTATSEIFTGHDCFLLNFSNGDSIIADSEHLWPVLYTNLGSGQVTTLELFRMLQSGIRVSISPNVMVTSVMPFPSVPTRCIAVDSPSNLYLCGRTMLPTHNTSLCAGLVLYFLINSTTSGTEVYSAGAAKDQAAIVFRYAQQMLQYSRLLQSKLKAVPSMKTIVLRDDPTSFYKAISADGDVHDGVNPSFVVRDEIHRWRNRKSLELNDLLERKMVKRFNALTVDITTAGEEHESPLGWRRHEYARRIAEGVFTDRRYYGKIWSANPKRIETEPGYWLTREARIEANPSHEANGGYVSDQTLEDLSIKARNDPQVKADYLRFNLNIWGTSSSGNRAIQMDDWARGDVPLRSLIERPCWAGLDLSTSIDLTAFVLIFPWQDVSVEDESEREGEGDAVGEGGVSTPRMVTSIDILPFFWIPEENVRKRELKDKVPYRQWLKQGYLEATEGNEVDYSKIREKIKWAAECFDLQEVCYDPCQATETVQYLTDEGIKCVPIKQGFLSMSAPTKRLIELVTTHRVRHNGHPVLTWNADCLGIKGDGNDLVRPVKPDRASSFKRIDGMVGIINALSRQMVSEGESVYTHRGLKFL